MPTAAHATRAPGRRRASGRVAELQDGAGSRFDPTVVEAFLRLTEAGPGARLEAARP